jgi:Rieske Fe-S protein
MDDMASIHRRRLLQAGATGGAALLASACSSTPAGSDGNDASGDVGAAAEAGPDGEGEASCGSCPAANAIQLTFAQYPALKRVGGAALVHAPSYSDPRCQQGLIIVAQPAPDQYVALSASCTHSCCTVRFTGSEFECPCHGSTYALDGSVTGGPAPAALQELAVCADACGVTVTIP